MRRTGRAFFLLVGMLLGCGGLIVVSIGLVNAARARAGASNDVFGTVGIGVFMIVVGLALGMASFPVFTAFAGLCLAAVSLLAGASLAVAAIVLSRVEPRGFDGDRATHAAWFGTTVALALAVGLLVNFLLWLRRRDAHRAAYHVQYVLATGYGAVLFLSGLVSVVRLVIGMTQVGGVPDDTLAGVLGLAGSAVLTLGPGAIFLWHGAGGLTRVGSARFRPPPVRVTLGAALGAIAVGAILLQAHVAVQVVPLAHAVAMVAPGLAIVAFVSLEARRVGVAVRSTWREILIMMAYGAAVAAVVAGIVNSFALVAAIVVYLAAHGSFDHVHTYTQFSRALRTASIELGESGLVGLLLLVIAVIGPFNEEFWKGFGVWLLRRDRPTRYQAFLWGLSSGVGFGMVEANEYSLSAFVRSPYRWWDTILLRGASSSLHALASGTVGIAWFYAFSGKRIRFLGLFLTAVGLHGSWNALNVLTAARVLPWFKTFSNRGLEIALDVALVVFTIFILLMLRLLSRSLADEELPPPAAPPQQASRPEPYAAGALDLPAGPSASPA